jgi:hypothetical protein
LQSGGGGGGRRPPAGQQPFPSKNQFPRPQVPANPYVASFAQQGALNNYNLFPMLNSAVSFLGDLDIDELYEETKQVVDVKKHPNKKKNVGKLGIMVFPAMVN